MVDLRGLASSFFRFRGLNLHFLHVTVSINKRKKTKCFPTRNIEILQFRFTPLRVTLHTIKCYPCDIAGMCITFVPDSTCFDLGKVSCWYDMA